MKTFQFQVHDIIETPGHQFPRLYSVESVLLGSERQEDLIELTCLDLRPGSNVDGRQQPTIHVPQGMLEAGIEAGIFTVTRA